MNCRSYILCDAIIDDLPVILDDTNTQDEQGTTHVKPVTVADLDRFSLPCKLAQIYNTTLVIVVVVVESSVGTDLQHHTDPMLPPSGFHLASYVVAVFLFFLVVALGVAWRYVTAPREPSLEEAQIPRNSDHVHLLSIRPSRRPRPLGTATTTTYSPSAVMLIMSITWFVK
ncbi:hypothetical protein LSAT2_027229 [Lamellibrachia satsuma]|nr:hypothetical protein LSAT2_027229 [Lamellibrachia satsuma]